jgi:uncharacterized membrane protein
MGNSKPSNNKAATSTVKQPCKCAGEINKKVNEKCEVKGSAAFRKEQEERNEKRERYNAKQKGRRKPGKKKAIYRVRDKTWKDQHCQKLLFDYEDSQKQLKEKLDTIKEEMEDLKEDFESVLYDKLGEVATDKIEKVAAVAGCAAAGAVVGGIIGFFFAGAGAIPGAALGSEAAAAICGAVAMADTVKDTVEGAVDIWNNKELIKKRIEALEKAIEKVDEFRKHVDELEKVKDDPVKMKEKKDKIYEGIAEQIKNDPCIKARRCQLISYDSNILKSSEAKVKPATPLDKAFKLDKPKGCCPGQRAHHLIPETKFSGCGNYTDAVHNKAPTVCAEGGHSSGTHGQMHTNTDANAKTIVDAGNPDAGSLDAAIESSAEAFVETFKSSKCNKACIITQLEDYYKNKGLDGCINNAVDKNGKPIEPDTRESDDEKL